eukprot:533472_1
MDTIYILSFIILYINHATSKILSTQNYTLYFDQYNFNSNNTNHWNIIKSTNSLITTCTIPIKSLNQNLCIHTNSKEELTLTFTHNKHNIQLDFYNNSHWNKINTIYNLNINENISSHRRLYNTYTYSQYLQMFPFLKMLKMGGKKGCGSDTYGECEPDWRTWYYSNRDKKRYVGNHFGGRGGFGGRGHIFKNKLPKMDAIANQAYRLAIMDHKMRTRGNRMNIADQMSMKMRYFPMIRKIMQYSAMIMDNNYNNQYQNYYYNPNTFYKGRRLVMQNTNKKQMEYMAGSADMDIEIEKCVVLENGFEICVMCNVMTNELNVNVIYKKYVKNESEIRGQLMDGYFDTLVFNWNDMYAVNVLSLIQVGDKVLSIEMGEKCADKWSFANFKLCVSVNNTDIIMFFKKMNDINEGIDVLDMVEMDNDLLDSVQYELDMRLFRFNNDNDWNEVGISYPVLYDVDEQMEGNIELFGRSYRLKKNDILDLGKLVKLRNTVELPITKMCSFMHIVEVCMELDPNMMDLKLSMQFVRGNEWSSEKDKFG